jgi:hypothetical protein
MSPIDPVTSNKIAIALERGCASLSLDSRTLMLAGSILWSFTAVALLLRNTFAFAAPTPMSSTKLLRFL